MFARPLHLAEILLEYRFGTDMNQMSPEKLWEGFFTAVALWRSDARLWLIRFLSKRTQQKDAIRWGEITIGDSKLDSLVLVVRNHPNVT